MARVTKFTLTGPIDSVSATTNGDDYRKVRGLAEIETVFENAHVSSGDDFAEYSDHYGLVRGGYLSFKIIDSTPCSVVEYHFVDEVIADNSEDTLTLPDGSVRALSDFIYTISLETSGQMSDGIGEGYEQYPCYEPDGMQYYISMGYPDLTLAFPE